MSCRVTILSGLATALIILAGVVGCVEPPEVSQPPAGPCTVSADRDDVPVHVRPGYDSAVGLALPVGQAFPVISQWRVDDGSLWWQLDVPGVERAWVSPEDVIAAGDCDRVPTPALPPLGVAPPCCSASPRQ